MLKELIAEFDKAGFVPALPLKSLKHDAIANAMCWGRTGEFVRDEYDHLNYLFLAYRGLCSIAPIKSKVNQWALNMPRKDAVSIQLPILKKVIEDARKNFNLYIQNVSKQDEIVPNRMLTVERDAQKEILYKMEQAWEAHLNFMQQGDEHTGHSERHADQVITKIRELLEIF